MSKNKIIRTVALVIILIFSLYASLTFPRNTLDFSVSFTVGADQEQRDFEMPVLHDKTQVQISVNSGSALWRARILDSDGNEVWEHTAIQGEQTQYTSTMIQLSDNRFNFTFGTLGIGNLQADIKVNTKGGFW